MFPAAAGSTSSAVPKNQKDSAVLRSRAGMMGWRCVVSEVHNHLHCLGCWCIGRRADRREDAALGCSCVAIPASRTASCFHQWPTCRCCQVHSAGRACLAAELGWRYWIHWVHKQDPGISSCRVQVLKNEVHSLGLLYRLQTWWLCRWTAGSSAVGPWWIWGEIVWALKRPHYYRVLGFLGGQGWWWRPWSRLAFENATQLW